MAKKLLMIILAFALLLGVLSLASCGKKDENGTQTDGKAAYGLACEKGYDGTPEQWIAALVGETVPGETESAYDVACSRGYTGSFDEWMKALTGYTVEDKTAPAYGVMVTNGYTGSLTEWLNSLVDAPEELGHSTGEDKTEYELACEYGFEGTYIEWMVSLVSKY